MVVRGTVVEGKKLGRKLGFPTANIIVDDNLQISNGVYRSLLTIKGVSYKAISNVGRNPTFGESSRRIESHILNFTGNIYGETIEVKLLEKLRDEMKFDSIEELRTQVLLDIRSL